MPSIFQSIEAKHLIYQLGFFLDDIPGKRKINQNIPVFSPQYIAHDAVKWFFQILRSKSARRVGKEIPQCR
jgi:hypothetical protein